MGPGPCWDSQGRVAPTWRDGEGAGRAGAQSSPGHTKGRKTRTPTLLEQKSGLPWPLGVPSVLLYGAPGVAVFLGWVITEQ